MRCCIQHTALLLLNSQLILNMVLSVVIPVYNVERYVEKCIRSCENQNIPTSDYEIIVVNDGSKDDSVKIIKSLIDQYNNITLINQENKGLSAARNVGIMRAHGDYIMFVDSDDSIEENCFEEIALKLKTENPDCLAIGAVLVEDSNNIKIECEYSNRPKLRGCDFLKMGVPHCAPYAIWKKEFLLSNNLFFTEGIYHEDSEFTPRAYYTAKTVSFFNGIVYYVTNNPFSITRSINIKKSYDLVKVVCRNLYLFSKTIDVKDIALFYGIISVCLNNALNNSLHATKEQNKALNDLIYDNRFVIQCLIKSKKAKYCLEGILFYLIPHRYVEIYKFLSLLKNNR